MSAESRHDAYAAWILDYVSRYPNPVAMCSSATANMVEAFPELRRVRGYCLERTHWWCVAPDGTIVDPTASQFSHVKTTIRSADYRTLTAAETAYFDSIKGKCMNCGELSFWHTNMCSRKCEREFAAYLNRR